MLDLDREVELLPLNSLSGMRRKLASELQAYTHSVQRRLRGSNILIGV